MKPAVATEDTNWNLSKIDFFKCVYRVAFYIYIFSLDELGGKSPVLAPELD